MVKKGGGADSDIETFSLCMPRTAVKRAGRDDIDG